MTSIVLIGGSAGSINALKVILNGLPADFPAPVLVVSHIGSRESILPALLERSAALPVRHAHQGDPVVAGVDLGRDEDVAHEVDFVHGRHVRARCPRVPRDGRRGQRHRVLG